MESIIVVALKGVILYDGRVLIVKRSQDDEVGANSWEFAGGKLEFGEELETALKREISEEVGLEIDVNGLLYATTFKTSEHRQIVILTYLCNAHSNKVCLSAEHQDFLWATEQELKDMLVKPIVNDMDNNSVWEKIF